MVGTYVHLTAGDFDAADFIGGQAMGGGEELTAGKICVRISLEDQHAPVGAGK